MATTQTNHFDVPEPAYMCRIGERSSLSLLVREPTANEWSALASTGMGPVTSGQIYWKGSTCRVTGDSYGAWYRDCSDVNGFTVGRIQA